MSYQPVGPKRSALFLLVERLRIFLFKIWYGPRAMSRLLATTVHPVMILEHFGATIDHPVYLRASLQIINSTNANGLTLARGVHIGEGTRLDLTCPITIGENSVVAQGTLLLTHQNKGRVVSPFAFENQESELVLESNVFISINSIVLSTADRICEGVIIGARTLVKETISEPGVYVGTPAKKIR